MDMGFLLWGDKNILKWVVVVIEQHCEPLTCTLNG